MSELRRIRLKHKQEDAAVISRALVRLENMRNPDADMAQVILFLGQIARLIDQAFEAKAEPKEPV